MVRLTYRRSIEVSKTKLAIIGVGLFLATFTTINAYDSISVSKAQNLIENNQQIRNESEFVDFVDPFNRFTLQVPLGWEVEDSESRFDDNLVSVKGFASEGNPLSFGFNIIKNDAAGQNLNSYVDRTVSGLGRSYTIFQEPEYNKYTIGGLPAADYIVIFPDSIVGMQVTALDEDDVYSIAIVTSETDFDQYLPLFEYMLSTVEFTDKLDVGLSGSSS